MDLLIANAGTSAGPDPDSPGEPEAATLRQIAVNLLGAVNTIAPLVPAMCARGRGRVVVDRLGRGISRLAVQPRILRQQGRVARLCRGVAPASGATRGRGDGRCPGFFAFADDRPLGRTDAVSASAVSGPPGASSAASIAARARIAFPWPLVLGMRFCDLAPALDRRRDPARLSFPDTDSPVDGGVSR